MLVLFLTSFNNVLPQYNKCPLVLNLITLTLIESSQSLSCVCLTKKADVGKQKAECSENRMFPTAAFSRRVLLLLC